MAAAEDHLDLGISMIDSLKKMYKQYGGNCLKYVELLLMEPKPVPISEFLLREYKDMGWLTYEDLGDGTANVQLTDPERLYPSGRFTASMPSPKKTKKKTLTKVDHLLKCMEDNFTLPVDFYIDGTRTYSPKYRRFARKCLDEHDLQECLDLYSWIAENYTTLPRQLEVYQLLSPVWIPTLIKWWDGDTDMAEPESLANREID